MQDSITIEGVPTRMYGYSTISTDCTPTSSAGSFASSSTTTVPDAQPGDNFKFCVLFQNNECMAVSSSTVSGECNIHFYYLCSLGWLVVHFSIF